MAVVRGILIVALAALAPFLYERYHVLRDTFYKNAPERLARVNALGRGGHEIRFADRVRSCEDVLLLEDRGLALTACDPGRERWNTVMGIFEEDDDEDGDGDNDKPTAALYLFDYKDASLPDSAALTRVELLGFHEEDGGGKKQKDLHTLGMALDEASQTLFVCNHARGAGGSRVEVFRLDAGRATATHLRTVLHPLVRGPNSIAAVSATEFYVTNDHRFLQRDGALLSQLETYLRLPTGTVVHVRLPEDDGDDNVAAHVVASLPYANGVEFLNATTLAVASTSTAAIYLYDVDASISSSSTTTTTKKKTATSSPPPPPAPKLALRRTFRVPFMPDNLSVSRPSGRLLVAGHAHPPTTFRFALTRRVCNGNGDAKTLAAAADEETRAYCASNGQQRGLATSWVAEWSEAGGLRDLYVDTEYPTSATAARDEGRGVGVVAGLYARGLLVWRE